MNVLLFLLALAYPGEADAYLDPGTGSYLIQISLSLLFGLLLAIKQFFHQIKFFFKNLFSKQPAKDVTGDE